MRTPLSVLLIVLAGLTVNASPQVQHYPMRTLNQQSFERSLNAIIGAAGSGFASYRGKNMKAAKWEAEPSLPGAYFCDVDWNEDASDPKHKASFYCDYGEGLTHAEALADFKVLKAAVQSVIEAQGWRGIIKQGDDSMVLFKSPDSVDSGWASIWFQESEASYRLFFSLDSSKTPAQLRQPAAAQSGTAMQEWVETDIREYIAASRTDFETFKGAPYRTSDGHRGWVSKQKPMLADSCQVVEMNTVIFTCALSKFNDLGKALEGYSQLVGYVGKALPTWTKTSSPFKAEYRSIGFVSSGLEGEIWLHSDPNKAEWTLNYQLLRRTH